MVIFWSELDCYIRHYKHTIGTLRAHVDEHCFWLRVSPQRMLAKLTPYTAFLGPAKRTRRSDCADAVHPDNACVDSRTYTKGTTDVLREHTSHESIPAVVALFHDLLLGVELVDHHDRAEDLARGNEGTVLGVCEYGGFDVEALGGEKMSLVSN